MSTLSGNEAQTLHTHTHKPIHPPIHTHTCTLTHRRDPRHQSHVLENRDTYRQAQICRRGHQESSGARGKRRGFSPGHSLLATTHTDFFIKTHCFLDFFGLRLLLQHEQHGEKQFARESCVFKVIWRSQTGHFAVLGMSQIDFSRGKKSG